MFSCYYCVMMHTNFDLSRFIHFWFCFPWHHCCRSCHGWGWRMVYLRGCHVIVSPSLFSVLELLFQVPNCFCHSFLLTSQSNYLLLYQPLWHILRGSVFLTALFYLSGNKGAFFVLQLDLLQEQSYLDVSGFMSQLGYFAINLLQERLYLDVYGFMAQLIYFIL